MIDKLNGSVQSEMILDDSYRYILGTLWPNLIQYR